jgi:alpha-N-acetylglucosaminidase
MIGKKHMTMIGLAAFALVVSLTALSAEDSSRPRAEISAAQESVSASFALISRVAPGHKGIFSVEIIPATDGKDSFEIETVNGKIVLRGNSALSVASAFNWYLRHEAMANFDWLATKPLSLPRQLPFPRAKIRRECVAKERFFLNYCTYGYTLPWWDWEQWQRFLDWMALNGINRPLLQCGQEAVWLDVWKSYGLADDQIRSYFSAPAHLPWHRMANLDRWGGPLPPSYIDGQKALQKKILTRARELGMRPILNAFAGHVPEALKAVKPEAKITRIATGWGGMEAGYATWFLDPKEPLFQEIQSRFLKKQAEFYGTDHLYGTDPFNEISPPSWEPEYLADVARTIYSSMAAADPDAVWYQMSWTFFCDHNWTPARLSAMTRAVPQGRMVYLDYVCEESEFFRRSDNFYGAPFIWCYLANFGGNTHLIAPLHKLSSQMEKALPVGNCSGVGSTLEGINVNPVAYDLLFEQPWHPEGKVNLDDWIADYAARRAGRPDASVRNAWKILTRKVFLDNAVGIWGHGIALQYVPCIERKNEWDKSDIPYKQRDLLAALEEMLNADPACRKADGYQFDVVNLTRQVLGNHIAVVQARMAQAYRQKDLPAFRHESARFLELGRDLEQLLGTRHEFLLGRWLADARSWGKTPVEQDYYEHNAREIITTWHRPDGYLTDYASRQWNGLIGSYYLIRWQEFFRRLDASLSKGEPFDEKAYSNWRLDFETRWLSTTGQKFSTTPAGDPFETASRLLAKYRAELLPEPKIIKLDKPAWSQAVVPGSDEVAWIYDASTVISRSGTYRIAFRYDNGESALTICRVALVQDGREVAVDEHDGWAGIEHRQNTYLLKADALIPGRPVSVVALVQAVSSRQTNGAIVIQSISHEQPAKDSPSAQSTETRK